MGLRKKKKGAAFIVVVIMMAIIFMTGTAVLAFTASNYKMRINESKKIQNLYEADSGLGIIENIIIKTSQKAIVYANEEVKNQVTSNIISKTEDELNKAFKEKFYEYLNKEVKDPNDPSKKISILKYLINNKEYINNYTNGNFSCLPSGINPEIDIEVPKYDITHNNTNGDIDGIDIDVKSTFKSKNDTIKNTKTISVQFKVKAPKFNSNVNSVNIYPVFNSKAITADGDMNVNSSNLNITGDVWIKGDDKISSGKPEEAFNKYKGGIKLNNSSFNIDGNVYTANTFQLEDGVKSSSSVKKDIYAKNIYVGTVLNTKISNSNNMTFENNVIVNNDLALNATNSNISVKKNFYGINDKNIETDTAKRALNSSSIIVNDVSGTSKIKVDQDSYIMGLAYLNVEDSTGQKYQTGESVAVKGNYLAYTDVTSISNTNPTDKYTLKYYSPLQLLESKNGVSNAQMKSEYFAEYYSQDKNTYKFNDGGVSLNGKVKSAGTSIKDNNGDIQKASIDNATQREVDIQKKNFGINVFAMGDDTGYSNLYDAQKVERTVENQIDFNKVSSAQYNTFNNKNGDVILSGANIEIDDNEIKIKTNNVINKKIISKGLIVVNGDITINGNFDFTGTIIAKGNIKFEGTESKKITYDSKVVIDTISANHDKLKDIFMPSTSSAQQTNISSQANSYNVDEFLQKSSWKIEK